MRGYNVERAEGEISVSEYLRDGVDVERFAALCRECPNSGRVWSCPPFDFDPIEMYWSKFKMITVFGRIITADGELSAEEALNLLNREKLLMLEECFELERNIPGSLALSAGRCIFCADCARIDGMPCRFPGKMRRSIESLGGNVAVLSERCLNTKLEWGRGGRAPSKLTLVGALLRP